MPKGYSKEMMEAMFRQQQEQQDKEKKQQEALKQKRQELLQEQEQKHHEELRQLQKQIKRLRYWVIAATVLALIAAAVALNESMKEWMLLLP